ncbi:hypothetical protein [Brevundimonas sp. Bb-A]|uniref:hypothetical protein n=1 Tax=Brevundimonas sp. Bb-A TaxID=2560058 RepID=UPI00128ED175|nr:hypothetical protein [Brevundimonas sp. Bb-A]
MKSHSKPLLLSMLEQMGDADIRAASFRKTDLVPWVEEKAAEKGWAPTSLSWTAPPEPEVSEAMEAEGSGEDADLPTPSGQDDGAGAFEVTPAGRAALTDAA